MASDPSIEVRGLRNDEAQLYIDLINDRAHTPIEYYTSHYDGLGGGDWNDSRVVLVDGEIASHVRNYHRVVRWGSGTIHCGGMGDVFTHPDHRRRGYGLRLLEDAVEQYDGWGCGVSMILSGVFEFYRAGGWERFPTYSFSVDVRPEWIPVSSDYRVRRFDRFQDLERVADIYEAYNRNCPLTLVRDREYWRRHFTWTRRCSEQAFYVAEADGVVVAYMRGDGVNVIETGYLDGHIDAAFTLLEAEMRLARSRTAREMSIQLPPQEPMVEFLKQLRTSTRLSETTLLRIVSLTRMLEALAPDFESRLKACDHPTPPEGSLAFDSGGYQATLTVKNGRVSVAAGLGAGAEVLALSQRQLFGLTAGSGESLALTISKTGRDLVEVLFPRLNPTWWPIDTV